jgi:pyruvate dehydrogenase E1 component alpha subunit
MNSNLRSQDHWALEIYTTMAKIRLAEKLAAAHYMENKVFSFVHFCVGQELAPAAFGYFSSPGDKVFGNHRSHGHFLGMGGSAFKMFSEMLGKETGASLGKGGSMHLIDKDRGFVGTSPILSSSLPLAAGSAWAQKFEASESVTIVYTGDGASEEGNFYETLNLIALWQLPLVIVVENNLYSVNSPTSSRRGANFSLEALVRSFGIDYFFADGTNPLSSMDVIRESYNLAKLDRKPSVIEVRAYRHLAHSSPLSDDKMGYRVEDTESVRSENDPLLRLHSHLLESGKTEAELELLWAKLEKDLGSELGEAVISPNPHPIELSKGLYA